MTEEYLKPLEILVVDDEPAAREVFKVMFEHQGTIVDTASNGQQAIDMYTERIAVGRPYDAVVTDLNMPKATGADVTRVVKGLNPSTLVYILTGFEATSQYQELSSRLGKLKPDAVLQKPITFTSIKKLVQQMRQYKEVQKTQPQS